MHDEKAQKASHSVNDRRAQAATRLYRERQFRSEYFFDSNVFGEPAWDILLHLYQGHSYDRDIKIKSVALATGLPATSSLRWLELLEKKGLVFAYRNESEIADIYLRLSPKGLDAMARYLDRVAIGEPLPIK
jgi:DNA-binding MarR family transcriptional regulator